MMFREVRMPFGRYQGRRISDIPHAYLRWLRHNVDLYGDVRIAVKQALSSDGQSGVGMGRDGVEKGHCGIDPRNWYRRLALEFHPDRRGGSKEAMLAIRRGYELLQEMSRD